MKPLAIVLAVMFLILAACAFTGAIHGGPRSLGLDGLPHAKHGVLYVILAVLSLIWLRFQSAAPARVSSRR